MANKSMRNCKTFIVVTNKTAYSSRKIYPNAVKQRLRVGAKDEKHARKLVREFVDSSTSINSVWEVNDEPQLERGRIIDDRPIVEASYNSKSN